MQGKRIVTEDLEWDMTIVSPLSRLALQTIATNFSKYPISLDSIPSEFVNVLITLLPVDLDVALATKYIDNQKYWQYRTIRSECMAISNPHGRDWRSIYFELRLKHWLEAYLPSPASSEREIEICQIASVGREFINIIDVDQLLPEIETMNHIDWLLLKSNSEDLPNLQRLKLVYSIRNARLNFDSDYMQGLTLQDCLMLSSFIQLSQNITHLSIIDSKLTDNQLEIVFSNSVASVSLFLPNLQVLNLSGNCLTVRQSIFHVLKSNALLTELDLSMNLIDSEGARILSAGLMVANSIKKLYINDNLNIRDRGFVNLVPGIIKCKTLQKLYARNIDLSNKSERFIAQMWSPNCGHIGVDLRFNSLSKTRMVKNRCYNVGSYSCEESNL
ncbi:hypothetical protein GJ496_005826 [Pomphorhynchus laevis]|nr:hypothetical protein GJ496_005826 [Pomphorhynchus laevis]